MKCEHSETRDKDDLKESRGSIHPVCIPPGAATWRKNCVRIITQHAIRYSVLSNYFIFIKLPRSFCIPSLVAGLCLHISGCPCPTVYGCPTVPALLFLAAPARPCPTVSWLPWAQDVVDWYCDITWQKLTNYKQSVQRGFGCYSGLPLISQISTFDKIWMS